MQQPADSAETVRECLHPLKSLRAIIELGLGHSFWAVECGACGRLIPKAAWQGIAARQSGRRGPQTPRSPAKP
jgi:hypothetical protein